jgi:hypothetical protein
MFWIYCCDGRILQINVSLNSHKIQHSLLTQIQLIKEIIILLLVRFTKLLAFEVGNDVSEWNCASVFRWYGKKHLIWRTLFTWRWKQSWLPKRFLLKIKTMNEGRKKKKMVSLSREQSSRVYRAVQSSMSSFTVSVAGKTVWCNLSTLSTSPTAP